MDKGHCCNHSPTGKGLLCLPLLGVFFFFFFESSQKFPEMNGRITYAWKACWHSLMLTDVNHDSSTNLEPGHFPRARNLDLAGGLRVVW